MRLSGLVHTLIDAVDLAGDRLPGFMTPVFDSLLTVPDLAISRLQAIMSMTWRRIDQLEKAGYEDDVRDLRRLWSEVVRCSGASPVTRCASSNGCGASGAGVRFMACAKCRFVEYCVRRAAAAGLTRAVSRASNRVLAGAQARLRHPRDRRAVRRKTTLYIVAGSRPRGSSAL